MNNKLAFKNIKDCNLIRTYISDSNVSNKIKDKRCVSIVICAKNNEKTIRKSLNSLLKSIIFAKRKFIDLDYELIIVYAPSYDNTLEKAVSFIREMNIENKVTFLCDKGMGLGYARRLGMLNSKCPFIVYADADKAISKTWLYKSLTKLLKDRLLGGVSDLPFILGKSKLAKIRNGYILAYYITVQLFKRWLRIGSLPTIRSGNSIWRKEALRASGGFSVRFRKANEDYDLSLKMRHKGFKLDLVDAISFQLEDHDLKTLVNIFRYQGKELPKVLNSKEFIYDRYRESLFWRTFVFVMIVAYPVLCIKIAKYFQDPMLKKLIGITGSLLWLLYLILYKLVVAISFLTTKSKYLS